MKSKICLNCGKRIEKSKYVYGKLYKSRKFCSEACYRIWREKQKEQYKKQWKKCEVCGKIFYNEKMLPPAWWEKKRVCSHRCAVNLRWAKKKNKKDKIEDKIVYLFGEAKVWINGKLVQDNGWRDKKWWKDKIEKAKEEIRQGKTILGA